MYRNYARLIPKFSSSLPTLTRIPGFSSFSLALAVLAILAFSIFSFLVIVIGIEVAKTQTSFLTSDSIFEDTCWQKDPSFYNRTIWHRRCIFLLSWKWCEYLLEESLNLIFIFIYYREKDSFGGYIFFLWVEDILWVEYICFLLGIWIEGMLVDLFFSRSISSHFASLYIWKYLALISRVFKSGCSNVFTFITITFSRASSHESSFRL